MEAQQEILKYLYNEMNYDYEHNVEILEKVIKENSFEMNNVEEHEKQMLLEMDIRSRQIKELQESFCYDISELNSKEYILNPEYAGILFLNDKEKWKHCFEKAKNGDVILAFMLGHYFLEGLFSKPMTVHAAEWYKIAAHGGHEKGMYELALCYRWGEGGVFVDAEKSIFWMRKAADKGNQTAKEFIEQFDNDAGKSIIVQSAISGMDGYGSKWYKCEKMVEKYFDLANGGDAEAQYELARQSIPGETHDAFKRNARNAEKYYMMAAEQGMPDAMFNLANLYIAGSIGFEPDIKKGFEWRKKCADTGDAEACYMLGQMCRDGQGIPVDMDLCIKYWKKAANKGFSPAVCALNNV